MTRLVHLSDLHFGYEHGGRVESLLACGNRQEADLVVVTGDLTHRARPDQFAAAASFLSRIKAPLLAVPGNHDIPLYSLVMRFTQPWACYRRSIAAALSPALRVGGVQVLGINSVDPFSWRRGALHNGAVRAAIARIDPAAINIVALHHPLQQAPDAPKELARNAGTALAMLEEAGVQIILSGHLHRWEAKFLLGSGSPARILQIHAGTALCARPEDPPNEFAVLEYSDHDTLVVARHHARNGTYDPDSIAETTSFSRVNGYWRNLD